MTIDRPNANPLSPAWFNERMSQEKEGRRREAFGAFEEDGPVEVGTPSGRKYLIELKDPQGPFVDPLTLLRHPYTPMCNPVGDQFDDPDCYCDRSNARDFLNRVATETFEDVAMEVFDEAFDLLVKRQRKYGKGNIETLGQYGVFTRMEDKMERIRHSMNGQLVDGQIVLDDPVEHQDESLDDADLDLMNYAAIRLIHRRGKWGKPLADEVNAA